MDDINKDRSSNDFTTSPQDANESTELKIQLLIHGSGEIRCLGYTLEDPIKNIIKGQCEGWLSIEDDELILLLMTHRIGPDSSNISFTSFQLPVEIIEDTWNDGFYVMDVDFKAYKALSTYIPLAKALLN